jgi:hypothetical protein
MFDINLDSAAPRDWKRDIASLQIIDLFKLLHADPGKEDTRPKGKAFIMFSPVELVVGWEEWATVRTTRPPSACNRCYFCSWTA